MTTPNPPGQLRIHTKYHWLTFMLSAFAPKATINGHLVQLAWGDNFLPAPAGVHNIEIHVPYLWKFGKAQMTVDNTYGVPTINYAAPVWTWMRGAIGTGEVKNPGLTAAWIFYGLFALAFLACCLGVALNGGGSGN